MTTFETDLSITEKLIKKHQKEIDEQCSLMVSESGLTSRSDLNRALSAGAKAVLVGESLMRQTDIRAGLRQLIGI